MTNDIAILNARIDALRREVAFALGQLFAATPALTVMRGPNDNMDRIMDDFLEAERLALASLSDDDEPPLHQEHL